MSRSALAYIHLTMSINKVSRQLCDPEHHVYSCMFTMQSVCTSKFAIVHIYNQGWQLYSVGVQVQQLSSEVQSEPFVFNIALFMMSHSVCIISTLTYVYIHLRRTLRYTCDPEHHVYSCMFTKHSACHGTSVIAPLYSYRQVG